MSERPRRFTEVIAMLTSIDEDDSGGESEIEKGAVLDWKLCSSDERSDDEETEQFDDAQPIVQVYKLLILTLKPILLHVLMMILVRELLKFRVHTRQQEMKICGVRCRNTKRACSSECPN